MGGPSEVPSGSSVSSPFFCVVVASSHGPARLAHALRGVRDQSVRDREVLVVDNSLEDVLPTVDDVLPEARLIRVDRSQDFAAIRNAGLAAASGRYVAFLDTEYVWHPAYLYYHQAALQTMPDALFTVSDYFLDGPRKRVAVRQFVPEPMADNALLQMVMSPYAHAMSCFVSSRADLLAAKGFDSACGLYADLDLCVRLLAGRARRRELACLSRPTLNIPHVLAVKTVDDGSAALDREIGGWQRQCNDFIAALFARPFMAPYAGLKDTCRSRLTRHQRAFFATSMEADVAAEPDAAEPPTVAMRAPVQSKIAVRKDVEGPVRSRRRKTRTGALPTMSIAMIHHGRTGSQALGDLLDQHPLIAWGGELFEPLIHELPRDPVRFLNQQLKECKKQAFGFETKLFHPGLFGLDMATYLAGLERIGFRKFIMLRRLNLFRAFVSNLVAMARGNVYHVPAGTSVKLQKLHIDPKAVTLLDKPVKLVNSLRYVTEQYDGARRLLVGREVLDLTYEEDISEDPLKAYWRVCDFLGLKNEPVEIRYGKTTPQKLEEIIENFDEIKEALAGTEFEWMVEE